MNCRCALVVLLGSPVALALGWADLDMEVRERNRLRSAFLDKQCDCALICIAGWWSGSCACFPNSSDHVCSDGEVVRWELGIVIDLRGFDTYFIQRNTQHLAIEWDFHAIDKQMEHDRIRIKACSRESVPNP